MCGGTLNGKQVASFYKVHGELNVYHRNVLADVILSDYLKDDCNKKLPALAEQGLALSIVEAFPSEKIEVWASSNSYKREKSIGRGILITRYYAMRRNLKKSGVIQIKLSHCNMSDEGSAENEDGDLEDLGAVGEAQLWLRNNKEPWSQVLELWKQTSNQRVCKLKGGTQTIAEYVQEYPALRDKAGFILLEADFETMYPDCSMKIYMEWPTLSAFIAKKLPHAVLTQIEDSFTSEGKKVRVIQALPYLFPVVTAAKKGKRLWRPSRSEVQDALVLRVGTVGDIIPAIKARRSKYEVFGLTLSPQAIVVGVDEDSITSSFVQVDDVLYNVANPLKAIDVAFKAMHSLDTKYHQEALREWLFLERAVYRINVNKKNDIDLKVAGLINEYLAYSTV